MSIVLNEKQLIVYKKLKQFCTSSKHEKFLLLAKSGCGKTTTVIKTLSETNLYVCFCTFTNKATKVMKDIVIDVVKNDPTIQNFTSSAHFQTIHSLLKLEPNTIDLSAIKKEKGNISEKLYSDYHALYKDIYNWNELKYLLKDDDEIIKNGIVKDTRTVDDLLTFKYNFKKLDYLKYYNIIVIDEVSTISRELYIYLESTVKWLREICNHNIKIIFLGDYYQLPPINEKKSIVFKIAQKEKWPLFKLDKVMRAKTNQINEVNIKFTNFIDNVIKKKPLISRIIQTPYNIIPHDSQLYIDHQATFLQKYVDIKEEDKIIITYSNSNCDKMNNMVQSLIDTKINTKRDFIVQQVPKGFEYITPMIWFLPNDRLVIVHPIIVPNFVINKMNIGSDIYREEDVYCVMDDMSAVENTTYKRNQNTMKIYNGDILIVHACENIKIHTAINRMHGPYPQIPKYFNGQLLTVYYASDAENTLPNDQYMKLLHVDTLEVEKARRLLKKHLNYNTYIDIMSSFRKYITTLKRGHCITCYKSQGSEFKHVFVNLKSFWACLASDKKINDLYILFSAFYTACTRSSKYLYLYF